MKHHCVFNRDINIGICNKKLILTVYSYKIWILLNYTPNLKKQREEPRGPVNKWFLLNDKLENLRIRYHRAVSVNLRTFRCPLRMKIVTVEGVLNMFYQYTVAKQKEIEVLKYKLFGEEPVYDPYEEEYGEYTEQ